MPGVAHRPTLSAVLAQGSIPAGPSVARWAEMHACVHLQMTMCHSKATPRRGLGAILLLRWVRGAAESRPVIVAYVDACTHNLEDDVLTPEPKTLNPEP
jgi:hypothetical protein